MPGFRFSARFVCLLLAAGVCPLSAAAPDSGQKAKSLRMITAPVPATRAQAYRAFRQMGESSKSDYHSLLEDAYRFCTAELKKASQSASAGKVVEAAGVWRKERDDLYRFVMTDHHKNGSKIAEMSRRFDALEKEHKRLMKDAEPALKALRATSERWTSAMLEIRREMDWALSKPEPDRLSASEMLRAADATALASGIQTLSGITDALDAWRAAEKHNNGQSWATPPQKAFATLLNQRRAVLLLKPLRIDEALCAASRQHSEEMVALGYFSHESPVKENRTPWDRARNAKFDGSAAGECIYAGSGSASSAHSGWWGSDGHRLIMYAEGINTLGIAMAGGSHWTLMSGKKDWSKAD